MATKAQGTLQDVDCTAFQICSSEVVKLAFLLNQIPAELPVLVSGIDRGGRARQRRDPFQFELFP